MIILHNYYPYTCTLRLKSSFFFNMLFEILKILKAISVQKDIGIVVLFYHFFTFHQIPFNPFKDFKRHKNILEKTANFVIDDEIHSEISKIHYFPR